MSRTRFWTILIGTEPTAFRASEQDALIPTLKQLQRRHPEAIIKWYEYGRIFDSPEQAEAARAAVAAERRPKDWRPGGEHRDPRALYKISRDEKRRRFKLRQRGPSAASGKPGGPPGAERPGKPPAGTRPPGSEPDRRPAAPHAGRRTWAARPRHDRDERSPGPKGASKPRTAWRSRPQGPPAGRRGPKKPREE
jgi:hypothetical protein